MSRVLVTGATGFIGQHLVALLATTGVRVRCLLFARDVDRPFGMLDVEYIRGDVTIAESLPAVVDGVDVVYHLAGATEVVRPVLYERVNAEGTRNLVAACARPGGPRRMVFVSSLAASGPSTPDRARLETDEPAPVSAYGRSKLAAEGHLWAAADWLSVTVVRPPGVLGPADPHTLPLFRTARWGIVGAPRSTRQRVSFIDVADLARALVLAAERGAPLTSEANGPDAARGVYYVAMDESPTYAELSRLAGAAVGRERVWTVPVPRWVCWVIGQVYDVRARLTGRPTLLSADKLREGTAGSWTCSAEKAKRELGFSCAIDLAESLRRTAVWYAEHGLL